MVTYLDRVCISMVAPSIMKDLGLDKTQMSYVFSSFTLDTAPPAPFAANVQAGFGSLGIGGRVYKLFVRLAGQVDASHYKEGRDPTDKCRRTPRGTQLHQHRPRFARAHVRKCSRTLRSGVPQTTAQKGPSLAKYQRQYQE